MESRTEVEQLKIRVSDLEEMVSNLIKWTQYDGKSQSSENSTKVHFVKCEENGDSSKKSKGSSKMSAQKEEREFVSFVCPNVEDDDKSMPCDRDTEADVDEIEIGPLEIVKVEENYCQNLENLAYEQENISSFKRIGESKDNGNRLDNAETLEEVTGIIDISDKVSYFNPSPEGTVDNVENCITNNRHANYRKSPLKQQTSNPSRFFCETCDKSFQSKHNLCRHENTLHSDQKIACPHCGKKFGDKTNMNRHIDTVHLCKKKFTCSQCTKKFSRKSSLAVHIDSVHLGIRHQCPNCLRSFSKMPNLRRHKKCCTHLKFC